MVSKNYLSELAADVVGMFLGGALAALALDQLDVVAMADLGIWKAAAVAGALGVLKGLAGRFIGDPDTTDWRR